MKRILCFFCFFLLSASAFAQQPAPVTAELIAEKETVRPEEEFFLALKLTLPKGWHVYWKNPGDAGEAVDLKLDLPRGFVETRRLWPTPDRFSVGSLTEYGYKKEAFLLIGVRAPEEIKTGDVLEISGRAVWLACHKECVPMAQEVSTLIMTGKEDGGFKNPEVVQALAGLPRKTDGAFFYETPDSLILSVPVPDQAETAYFFSETFDVLNYSAPQSMKTAQGKAFLFMKKAVAEDFKSPEKLSGTAVFYNIQGERVDAINVQADKTRENLPVFQAPFVWREFLTALLFAFLGGLLLNVMPCVFPVLSLKAFRLLNAKSTESPADRRKAGISYASGAVVSFLIIGGLLIALRTAGTEMGWGFQLQYPPFVLGLCLFMFFLGLIFSGVIDVGENLSAFSMNLGKNWGDFGTGVLAVLAATPCAAPFMGTALGYGLMSPAVITMSVFAVMGFGLAFPFVLLDFSPALGRFLPKPGVWTMLVKKVLAFPLYGASAWLLWVLAAQEGSRSLAVGLAGIIATAFCCWLIGEANDLKISRKVKTVVSVLTLIGIGYCFYAVSPACVRMRERSAVDWKGYNAEKIREYRQVGVPVFIKFSAKWCLTCLVNEQTAFSSAKLAETFRQKGVAAFSADWTNRSDEITAALESFGRGGVPLYVYYAPYAKTPQILPQVITEQTVLSLLEEL